MLGEYSINSLKLTNSPRHDWMNSEIVEWAKQLDILDVEALNRKVVSGEIEEIILVAEGLHEKKIASIADEIYKKDDKIRLVLIAGPSSSGKTTFSKRLSVQLKVLGLMPIPISLDDYFLDKELIPVDDDGKYDLESVKALDLPLINSHLSALINGEDVELPCFNFITGCREWRGRRAKMEKDSLLILEGIHGLNDMIAGSLRKDNKYSIYINALSHLNIYQHYNITASDLRMLRRIVRDNLNRGRKAETTIMTWPSVRKGEEMNIFPFCENADNIFNSILVYETGVIKTFAEPLLREIPPNSPVSFECGRLLKFLSHFQGIGESLIPQNSIIREFIGGSCF